MRVCLALQMNIEAARRDLPESAGVTDIAEDVHCMEGLADATL